MELVYTRNPAARSVSASRVTPRSSPDGGCHYGAYSPCCDSRIAPISHLSKATRVRWQFRGRRHGFLVRFLNQTILPSLATAHGCCLWSCSRLQRGHASLLCATKRHWLALIETIKDPGAGRREERRGKVLGSPCNQPQWGILAILAHSSSSVWMRKIKFRMVLGLQGTFTITPPVLHQAWGVCTGGAGSN